MIWLQHFYAQPNGWNISVSIAAYLFATWATMFSLVVVGWQQHSHTADLDRTMASLFWPISIPCILGAKILLAIYHLSMLPALAARKHLTKFKCDGCNSRVPWASTYCPKCGFKRTKERE